MRPLKLRFKGLRSYRAEQEIDFTNVGLMAIVGNTGAGKSSIAEAICYALYGTCTWDGKGSKQLVAQGSDGSLSVELTFQAQGKTWRVTRTASATNYPPSTHRLEGLEDHSQVDDARPVNSRIRELIGLDHGAFLKAVVLPQGRFQELIETSAADRTTALKSILGLDQITEVRTQAGELYDRLQPLLAELETKRAKLLDDPQAAMEDAKRRLAAANERRAELERLEQSIKEARLSHDAAAQRAEQCRAAEEQLLALIADDIKDHYRQLLTTDNGLEMQLFAVDRQLEKLAASQATLDELRAIADAEGTGVSGTATAIATLSTLRNELPEVGHAEDELNAEQASIEAQAADLEARRATQAKLIREAQQAEVAAKETIDAHRIAVAHIDRVRSLLETARQATLTANQTAQSVEGATHLLEERSGIATDAREAAEQAERDVDDAAAALEVAQRANAAAHAASASHPGDPCPICVRPLSNDFTAPTATTTDQAEAALTDAKKRAKTLATRHVSTVEQQAAAKANLENAVADESKCRVARDEAVNAVNTVLRHADLDAANDDLLAGLQEEMDAALNRMNIAQAHVKAIRDTSTTHAGEIQQIEKTVATRRQALTKARTALAQRKERMAADHASLPEAYQITGSLSVAGIDEKLTIAQERNRELTSITAQLDEIHKQTQGLNRRRTTITSRRHTAVGQPAAQLGRRVQTLADRATHAATLVNATAPPDRPESLALATDARWATEVITAVRKITEACQREAATQREQAAKASVLIADALHAVNLAGETALTELLDKTKTDTGMAERDLEQATNQLAQCRDLDTRITTARPLVASLRELAKVLADGKFMAFVVRRRQRALLGLATKILMLMTDQFAFADDFRMVDRHTGQPRDVQTLSGGEKFLASLALALALVELTSRGGGRVEALFLDEGFGSLDTNALGEALEALTHQATAGRLVAVISHMRAVAEYFDDILLISKRVGGSEARWATPAERDQLLTDELGEGLVE